jgi:hypothetical protein
LRDVVNWLGEARLTGRCNILSVWIESGIQIDNRDDVRRFGVEDQAKGTVPCGRQQAACKSGTRRQQDHGPPVVIFFDVFVLASRFAFVAHGCNSSCFEEDAF